MKLILEYCYFFNVHKPFVRAAMDTGAIYCRSITGNTVHESAKEHERARKLSGGASIRAEWRSGNCETAEPSSL